VHQADLGQRVGDGLAEQDEDAGVEHLLGVVADPDDFGFPDCLGHGGCPFEFLAGRELAREAVDHELGGQACGARAARKPSRPSWLMCTIVRVVSNFCAHAKSLTHRLRAAQALCGGADPS